jgi:flagellar hook assembly protein FlgD
MDNYINAPTYWYINIPESAVDENVSNLHNASKLNIFPNPFSQTAQISYSIVRDPQSARLGIYNAIGQLVVDLSSRLTVHGSQAAFSWSGSDDLGRRVPSGVYFVKLVSDDQQIVQKLILLR